MLHPSDDDAATTLWKRYGAEDYATRFPSYGMTDMKFTDEHPHTWGWILTTTNDLDRLMSYVLTKLPAIHRDYIVHEMRTVDPNQQWGVWGAGHTASPGNKNGWSDDNDDGCWITNSVGFVGSKERFHRVHHEQHKRDRGRFRRRQRSPPRSVLKDTARRLAG